MAAGNFFLAASRQKLCCIKNKQVQRLFYNHCQRLKYCFMKKNISVAGLPFFLFSMALLFSSCLKDHCSRTYKIYTPVYTKMTTLRATVQSMAATPVVNTGKLYVKGNWIFLNEQNRGIHVIDNSNPAHPVKTSFINIPGNIDMAVKNNLLYADLYSDLAVINISDPKRISVEKYLTNTFSDKSSDPNTSNPDSINIITSWASRDTVVSCADANNWNGCINCGGGIALNTPAQLYNAAATSDAGVAGSQARFAAVNNYLYAVTTSNLNVINITDAANPQLVQKKNIGWDIETIFPYNNKLFIGAGTSMSAYDLQDPANPALLSWNGHWCSRDPVVVDGKYAYVTLHAANFCRSSINELEVYDISVPNSPTLVKTYPLTHPQGLSKEGNLLFICDANDGFKVFDAADVNNIRLIKRFPVFDTYDVIALDGRAYVVGKSGLSQYDYSNLSNIHLLSKL